MLNNKKKILYLITQSELGGAQRYIFDLANNLKNEFDICVALGEQGETGELAKQLKIAEIKYFVLPHLKRSISLINDWKALGEIKKLIQDLQPDIVHLNSSKISILGSFALLISKFKIQSSKFKVIYTAHGWVFNEPLSFCQKLFYKLAEKFTSGTKDKIICVSEYDRQIALKYKIALESKLITIHNGIEPINFLTGHAARSFSDGQNMVVGTIGNLYKTKGFKYLIEAANILINKEKLPFSFFIVGEGEERKNLETLITKLDLAGKVLLPGRMLGAAKILLSFDIYACSSVKEGLSYTILEAMAAGLPIVATSVGGNSELIENNISGLLASAQDSEALAEKIKILFKDELQRKNLGEEAKNRLNEKFSLKDMIEKTREVYNSL